MIEMKKIKMKNSVTHASRKGISVTLKPKRNRGMLNQFAHCDEVMNFSLCLKLSGGEDAYTRGDEEGRNDDGAV